MDLNTFNVSICICHSKMHDTSSHITVSVYSGADNENMETIVPIVIQAPNVS